MSKFKDPYNPCNYREVKKFYYGTYTLCAVELDGEDIEDIFDDIPEPTCYDDELGYRLTKKHYALIEAVEAKMANNKN